METHNTLFAITVHTTDSAPVTRGATCKRTAQYILDELLCTRWVARKVVSIEVTRKGVLVPAMSVRPSTKTTF
jgi:hypothetical protein